VTPAGAGGPGGPVASTPQLLHAMLTHLEMAPTRPTLSRRAWIVLASAILLIALAIGVPLAAGTRLVNEVLDGRSIAAMAAVTASRSHGPILDGAPYANATELELLTRPDTVGLAVSAQPLRRFRLDEPGLTEELVSFASAIRLDHPESNLARAYVYRHGQLGQRPVVLWVPGQYVMDLASIPISWFTRQIVRRGADVVLLVPPYHLERSPAGFSSGDAVFATSLKDHLNVFAQELSDLRRLVVWLRAQGVRTLGGFGGSVGALTLLRTASWDKLDFLTVFIPIVRLASLLDQPEADPMRRRIATEAPSADLVIDAYAALGPGPGPSLLDPGRISVLYGRYDRVTTEAQVTAWAATWGVHRLHAYPRGHALSLFTPSMYADYARILDDDLRALGW
jgi:hypothetical protein